MKKPPREHDRWGRPFIFGLSLFLAIPCSFSMVQAVTPITSSGLNTQIGAPTTLPGGQTVYDITGGTRPGNGPNLFHSFGDFNVPTNNIANFLNDSGLATSNILGRVTGGNISNIFGTIQTTGFGNANLFLMNPAGFLFGPTATVNVGGMMTFTSANSLKLADGVRFNANSTGSADLLLSTAPVAAFGFLGSNPGAITVQGSQLSVADGAGISLVGGNMTVQAGTLTAPGGQIDLVSVGKTSNPKVGGEVTVAGSGQGAGFTPTGFQSLGTITLSQGSTLDVSGPASNPNVAGSVVIRGGQFVMDGSSLQAVATGLSPDTGISGGSIEVTAEQVTLSNHSTIDTTATSSAFFDPGSPGHITFNVGTFSAADSTIMAKGNDVGGGAVTIQGIQGSGSFAHSVSLTNTEVSTSASDGIVGNGGPILFRADTIALNQSTLDASPSFIHAGGSITLVSKGGLDIQNSSLATGLGPFTIGGPVDLIAGTNLNLASTSVDASGTYGGNITMTAPVISLRGSSLGVWTDGGPAGTISLTATKAVVLSGSTLNAESEVGTAGTIQINGGAQLTSQQSTISAGTMGFTAGTIRLTATKAVSLSGTALSVDSFGLAPAGTIQINGGGQFISNQSTISAQGGNYGGNGGTIQVEAARVRLTDTQLTTSVSGGPQSAAGSITVEANKVTLKNSQMLSTATEGHGGTIQVEAARVRLTDTQLTTSVSGGPQSAAGSITVEANKVTLKNSQMLSTATEGHGGTIDITSHVLHRDASSVIDASSHFGTDGTVTINGIIQP